MDRIILTSADVTSILEWRDNNKDLVRRAPSPFKGILLVFPDTNITVKVIRTDEDITFYISIGGSNVGKFIAEAASGGMFRVVKNNTKLLYDDVQSIITVYASTMALISFYTPTRTTEPKHRIEKPSAPSS